MTLPADLNVYISAIMFFLGAYLFALYLGMIVWTVRDIRARSRDSLAHILATALVAVFNVPGLLVYMLLRPHSTVAEEYERSLTEEAILQELEERRVCPGCRRRTEADFIVCPHCHYQLRLRCTSCGRLLNPGWDVCPYCGLLQEAESDQEGAEVAAPNNQTAPVGQPAVATVALGGDGYGSGAAHEPELADPIEDEDVTTADDPLDVETSDSWTAYDWRASESSQPDDADDQAQDS